jgi:hypothetical protein
MPLLRWNITVGMVTQSFSDCTVWKNALHKTANNKTRTIGETGIKETAVTIN